MQAVVSIHDVMPHNLNKVENIVNTLPQNSIEKLTLLVVPGLEWRPELLQRLRRLQELGIQLAGHGWTHRCKNIGSLYHFAHSKIFSRMAAEHLAMDHASLKSLLEENYQWFVKANLTPPNLYVPPAWAKGDLNESDLKASPFKLFETFTKVYDLGSGRVRVLPIVGFEADSYLRTLCLKTWNSLNTTAAGKSLPLRVAIHPNDLALNLRSDVLKIFTKVSQFIDYQDLMQCK